MSHKHDKLVVNKNTGKRGKIRRVINKNTGKRGHVVTKRIHTNKWGKHI